jgi:hypothetical protein
MSRKVASSILRGNLAIFAPSDEHISNIFFTLLAPVSLVINQYTNGKTASAAAPPIIAPAATPPTPRADDTAATGPVPAIAAVFQAVAVAGVAAIAAVPKRLV